MKAEITACVIAGIISAVVTFLASFPLRKLAIKIGAVVAPDHRRIHKKPLPYLGGVAMMVALGISIAISSVLKGFDPVFKATSEPVGLFLGAFCVFLVGLLDDLFDLSAPAKLAGQILAASILYLFGITMYQFKIPFAGFIVLSPSLEPLITALWVIGIANAVNLIDGLDGLAAGIVAIASGSLCVYGLKLMSEGYIDSSNLGVLISAVTCGICLGFLPVNFNPARIIMGDSGALLLGTLMAAATMLIGGRTPDVSGETYFFFAPLFIPFFILGVPILDMIFAIVRRAASGKSVAHPDVDHLHHRLLRLGHGQRRAVGILWVWTAVLSAFVLYPTFDPNGNKIVPIGSAILGAILYTWFRPGLGKQGGATDVELDVEDIPETEKVAANE
jgi:UDP-GlcNAc:undecaprenyl-phosphate GlcNAc-1-phosphate transferase